MKVLAGLVVGVAVAQGVAPAAVAPPATSVQFLLGKLTIQAGAGVSNKIFVKEQDGTVHVSDVVPISATSACHPVTTTEVSCPAEIRTVAVSLGDGDDRGTFMVSAPVTASGGPGNDSILGGRGDDTLTGEEGNDTIEGAFGADTITGGAGADRLYGDRVTGEPSCLGNMSCWDTLYGEEGEDYLAGGESGDHLFGGLDSDKLDEPSSWWSMLDGGPGNDTLIGAGTDMRDMAVYDDRTADVGVNLSDEEYNGESVHLLPRSGGELGPDGELREHDRIINVQDISTGDGDDILIGRGGTPVMDHGKGNDLCDPDGNDEDGVVLTPCP